ncbi:hypothetical protein [Hyalangium minutum]|uniref:Uncharacterized protein n=1 Tax=Hyalangium minutum TaxID=394096 RepID=A0A085W6D8_9BACT|nr:hypothetical protein [Hyalangium minutum]KFE63251.1 hypothetical protein DB31_2844 [Hyalangium minutum]
MRFESRQRISGTVDEVERAMLDPRYPDFLLKHHGVLLEVQQMEFKDEGDKVRRKVRYRPKPVIATIGPKRVPPEWFAFVETSIYDKKKKELAFNNVPTSNTISKMLVNTGTLKLRDVGGATERSMDGEISLKLPLLMKPLALIGEKVIQSEGLKILDGEAPVLTRFIAEVLRKG